MKTQITTVKPAMSNPCNHGIPIRTGYFGLNHLYLEHCKLPAINGCLSCEDRFV